MRDSNGADKGFGLALSQINAGEETLREPLRLKPFEHWIGHIPFAFWLVSALRPRMFVELGTHRGNSYMAFCQALEAEHCDGRAFGIDTWEGDAHMAHEVGLFEEISTYNEDKYAHFSTLMRSTFDEALTFFEDKSIDLLHIDGTHTYESVKNDFESWKPKLSDRAVVLFHDTNIRRDSFGVWRLWAELSKQYPHFEFFHSCGLGVLGVGTELPEGLRSLFQATEHPETSSEIRAYFSARGSSGVQRYFKEVAKADNVRLQNDNANLVTSHNAQHQSWMLELQNLQDRHSDLQGRYEAELQLWTRELQSLRENNDQTISSITKKMEEKLKIIEQGNSNYDIVRSSAERMKQEIIRTRAEVIALRQSTSWRITKPVRQLKQMFKGGPSEGSATQLPVETFSDPLPRAYGGQTLALSHSVRMNRWPIKMPDLFELRQFEPKSKIAAVVHVYYPEMLEELISALSNIGEEYDLFVTLVEGKSSHLESEIKSRYPEAVCITYPNRGRDILPFMSLVDTGAISKYEIICKIHSKKSPHRMDGEAWRKHLVQSILPSNGDARKIIELFRGDPDMGLVVADGQIFNGDEFWGGNLQHINNLLPLLGYELDDAVNLPFAGGSMFWIRASILSDLKGLAIEPEAYEPEPIGTDGALAHAIERAFSIACHSSGMRIEQASVALRDHALSSEKAKQETEREPRVVAFYLPQFHPIPENDRWWGKGFTEWTNVTKAKPLFAGHRQPRLPGELGFADLRVPETRNAQADLAKAHGVSAFCYYYYWFGRDKRLLERPLMDILESGSPDFPFMICWANEPWSRNWDGAKKDVLMSQDYEEGWIEAFAEEIAPIVSDPRYVRLQGPDNAPIVMIYRIMHIPKPQEAMRTLRAELAKLGVPKVHLSAGWLDFADDQPLPDKAEDLGLDSFFEFPPHRVSAVPVSADQVPEGMTGGLYDYRKTVDGALARFGSEAVSGSNRHRAVMMGWDNTARRGQAAHVFKGATPGHFRRWLRAIVRREQQATTREERLILVNAWNEWAEGTCLEPDKDFGRGWLQAVRSALGK